MGVGRAASRALMLIGLAAFATRAGASELGPKWFHVDGGWGYVAGPFALEEAVNAGSLTLGASFPLAYVLRMTVRPAFSLATGFRRYPKQGGLAPRVVLRYLLLLDDKDGAQTLSLSLGLGF